MSTPAGYKVSSSSPPWNVALHAPERPSRRSQRTVPGSAGRQKTAAVGRQELKQSWFLAEVWVCGTRLPLSPSLIQKETGTSGRLHQGGRISLRVFLPMGISAAPG